MNLTRNTLLSSFTLALAFALSANHSFANIPEYHDLEPNRAQQITSVRILEGVNRWHLRKHQLDNALSEEFFDRYIETLDSGKAYFLASDIQAFEPYRDQLDEALQSSDLKPAFQIFNRYQERISERLKYTISLIQKGIKNLDFTIDETLERDPDKSHWAKNEKELNDLSRRRLKDTIISMRLMGKKDKDIEKTLKKRYTNQLNRVNQANSEDAFELYMNAFTQIYDPHTQYFSPKVSENFDINMNLQLEGIGAVLQSDEEFTKVVSLVTGGPAEKGQELKEADRIIGVGQSRNKIVDVVGWRLDEVVQRIRGKKGTTVFLEVIPASSKSDSDTRVVSIKRDTVNLEDRAAQSDTMEIETEEGPKTFGVINVPAFYANLSCQKHSGDNCRSTTHDVSELIKKLKAKKVDGLVVDLRNNGGGSLTEVNDLLGLFIKTGPTVQIKSSSGNVEVLEDDDPSVLYDGPLAVMVNRLSASASEIFAGAIQDYQRGIIVGDRTFGKGTVQSLQPLNYGSRGDRLKVTMAKFYRVSGVSNQHAGIVPDIEYPSLIDHEEIGESSLPNALPSDQIRPARYYHDTELESALTFLRAAHNKRVDHNPEFQYVRDQMASLEVVRNKTEVSLNWKTRQQEKEDLEQKRLQIENKRRSAKGEKPFKDIEQLKSEMESESNEESAAAGKHGIEIDYELKETGHVLADFIELHLQQTRMAAQ
ncbi:tail-specific protease [Ketobacter sp. MCCC 1A13808]|uniref:carboxy terminal-processing peptidase n=1 Tax=Ketobacter sp. MCCC 1A13808 TaxID=2602738 RepID=UPI0012EBDBD9|nr:carboxy terminal-processing peptidase [Ketobacter sp. MCCC 1A13808]MVF12898.1 tail-specific protease [Ketobacter sp. MCCC 1A13808]